MADTSLENIAQDSFLEKLRHSKLAKGITSALAVLALSASVSAKDPFEGRKVRVYQVPSTTHQWIFDVTNHQLRNVDSTTQAKYEDALAKLFKLGSRGDANDMLRDIRDIDAEDGKIDNFEIIKHYVDSDDPKHSNQVFMLKYKKNHYDFKETPNPEDPAYLFGQGYGYLKLNKLFDAQRFLDKALAQTDDPHNKAIVHNYLGNLQGRKGNTESAMAHYQKAIELDDNYLSPHFNLASDLYESGKKEEALKEYKKCLKIDPNHKKSVNNVKTIERILK